ncbi:MAG: TonB-dependent receptor [Alphaproteobacteria bacterium]|nr:TonB-dependent receptor [Alphaproteobacteria bacterium]
MAYGNGASRWAILAALGAVGFASAAHAQSTSDEIVVTGSLIRGTPEDAALPVDVFTAVELQRSGSPTITELVRTLGVSSGIDGATNQFTSNGLEGLGNVNLRGLGPSRTLVLMNGRRMVNAPYGIGESAQSFVDTNLIPANAIGRIEVLKDGAAATYGSDAIAGVVNFITRRGFEGFEIGGDYTFVDGSDGDYGVNATWGWRNGPLDVLIAGGYQFRSELSTLERDWAIRSFAENPEGGFSSISNPGRFLPASTGFTTSIPDPGCVPLGGTLVANQCRFQFTQYDNLVEEEERYQIYGEANYDFGDDVEFHIEGMYSFTDVPEWKTSPSYPPQVLTAQFVPGNHPGLLSLINQTGGATSPFQALTSGSLFIGRTFGWGGFPGTGYNAQQGYRTYEAYRVAASLSGQWDNGVGWDASYTFMQDVGERLTNDTYITRLASALNGLGGPNCTGTTPGANGCLYYNPFSTAIPASGVTGAPNALFDPTVENTAELANWLTDPSQTEATTRLTVLDFVLNGPSGFELPGGGVDWALGVQWRIDEYELDPNDLADLTVNPCPVLGSTSCVNGTGPFAFLAGTTPANLDRDLWAAFGELSLPITDSLEAQLAVRYEDYGGEVGSTTDPKLSLRWQATPFLAFRASTGTTFRGPTLNQLSGQFTTLQFVAPTNAFKAIDTFGNPNLQPESAFTYNVGALLDIGGFTGSIDYWSFEFEDPVTVEPFDAILGRVLADCAREAGGATMTAAELALRSRVTFATNCVGSSVQRVRTNIINGPTIETSGVDVSGEYEWVNAFFGGDFTLGASATYLEKFEVGALSIEGVQTAAQQDLSGLLNRGTGYRSMPDLKGELFANFNVGDHNIRWISRYVTDYTDQRATITGAGKTIDSQWTHDIHYVWEMPWGTRFSASVNNVTDEDPPFARLDLNYDPYTHNAIGRTYRIGLTHRFGGAN